VTLLSPGLDDLDFAAGASTFGCVAGFAMAFPLVWPRERLIAPPIPMWLILLEKTRQALSAPQHLSDCFRNANRAGQFLSVSRSAARANVSA
jgi:hypothetical protein